MNTKLGVAALITGVLAVGVGVGCGSSTSGTGGTTSATGTGSTSGTTSTTSTHAATTGAGTTTGTGAGTTSSTGTGGGNDCATMCADIKTACTGALFPYASDADCATKCATLTPGTPGAASGNTIACRIYHAGVAGMNATNAMTHCPHTGVPSKNSDGTPGPCM